MVFEILLANFHIKIFYLDPTKNPKSVKSVFGADGSLEVEGMAPKYESPSNVHEIILRLNNLSAAYYELYYWDYTPLVLMRGMVIMEYN